MWERYPCFGPHNTVLVDNHAEKFERNPLGSCVLLREYVAGAPDDGALDPGGELCMHLRAMAAAGDTLQYIRDRAGTSDLFLERHPAPPPVDQEPALPGPSDLKGDAPPPAPEPASQPTTHQPPLQPAQPPSAPAPDLGLQFLRLTRHPDEVAHWQRARELPSTRALTLRRRALDQVLAARDYLVCEKTDGVRYCLLATRAGAWALLDRAMEPRDYSAAVSPEVRAFRGARAGDTALDGELVRDRGTGADMFLVFDAIVVDGVRTGLWRSLARRLRAADGWLDALLTAGQPPLDLVLKTQLPCTQVRAVTDNFAALEDEAAHGWEYSDGLSRHSTDGLVFTPANATYYNCWPLKWKPVELLTVRAPLSVALSVACTTLTDWL